MVLQITDASFVAHAAIEVDPIRHGHAVLGDHDLRFRLVIPLDAHQDFVHPFGVDFPHARVFVADRMDLFHVEHRDFVRMLHHCPGVVVDSQNIQAIDFFKVAGLDQPFAQKLTDG